MRRSPNIVTERQRVLCRFLDAAKYPIVTVVAPAGYGKSTAIRHFLQHCADPILIGIPASAATLDGFLRAFGAGCAKRYPSMAVLPDEPGTGADDTGQRTAQYVAWALAHLSKAKCTIAVDDLHHTDQDPSIASFLQQLAEASKDHNQWLFSSRTYGNLPHNSWQAYADADATITASDLRMSYSEALDICRALGIRWR
jgi:ATP/maltotriose-dependent transcriptional regulator MalT